jgi:hypothetical protein
MSPLLLLALIVSYHAGRRLLFTGLPSVGLAAFFFDTR